MLKKFITDAVSSNLSDRELWQKYFCVNELSRTDQDGERTRMMLEYWLSQQRKLLRQKQLHLDEVTFTPFDALPADEIPPKPFHMLSETKNVYVVQHRGEIVLYILLQDDKIASTLLIGQGDEHYFMNFCN